MQPMHGLPRICFAHVYVLTCWFCLTLSPAATVRTNMFVADFCKLLVLQSVLLHTLTVVFIDKSIVK